MHGWRRAQFAYDYPTLLTPRGSATGQNMATLRTVLIAAFLLAACGDEDDRSPLDGAESLQGIYRIDQYLVNTESCDAEGSDVLESLQGSTFMFGVIRSIFFEYLDFASCRSVAECRQRALGDPELIVNGFSAVLFRGDGTSFNGELVTSGFTSGDSCVNPQITTQVATKTSQGVRIEARTQIGEAYPPDADGFCTTDLGRAAAIDAPCSIYAVVVATKLEDL